MRKTALITGASSGIGYELSKIFAKNDYNLVLVSRDADKLESISGEIKKQYGIQVKVLPKDLSRPLAPQELYDEVTADDINIDVLVNNAGVGSHGKFTDTRAEELENLMQINMAALTLLCRKFGADMVKSGSGKILNVASTAAFQAGPLMSVYYASKAYVLLLSEGLRHELKKDGVTVTVLCPGATRTRFFKRSNMIGTNIEKSPLIMSAAKVAEIGFSGLIKGKTIVIPGLINKLMAFSVRLTPRSVTASITSYLHQR